MASLDIDKKKALGRGLASLIPDAIVAGEAKEGLPTLTPKKEYFLCDIDKIVPNTYQPRKIFSREQLDELVSSIKEVGILQPITVRQKDGQYEIIAGERRWRAAQRAGLKQVPVLIRTAEDEESLIMAVIENVQRADLNCVEEAIAYQQMMDEFQFSQEEIATKVGKNRATVANTMRLLKLPAAVREDLTAGKMSMGHARALLSLEDAQDQLEVRELILKKKLSVRDTERKVNEVIRAKSRPDSAPKPADPNLKALEDDLRREYGAPVKIIGNIARGFIQISYGTADELMRITDRLKAATPNPVDTFLESPLANVAVAENGEVVMSTESAPLPAEGSDVSPQV